MLFISLDNGVCQIPMLHKKTLGLDTQEEMTIAQESSTKTYIKYYKWIKNMNHYFKY